MGITWGLWISPAAQRRANWLSIAFGIGLSVVGLSALVGMRNVDVEAAKEVEDRMGLPAVDPYRHGADRLVDALADI